MGDAGELDTEVLAGLPPGGEGFLDELRSSLEFRYVRSIIFFGSTVNGQVSASSDIDFIIVLTDDAPDGYESELKALLRGFADRHLETDTRPANLVERAIQRLTGAFRSGFVTTTDDVREGKFHRIFDTSRLAYLLAPWRTVMAGAFDDAVSIYQDPVTPDWSRVDDPLDHSIEELFRSMIMTVSMAAFQVLYSLVSDRGAIYSQEAYKWAVYNITYHVTGRSHRSLDEALDTVPDFLGFHGRFERLREDTSAGLGYQVGLPLVLGALYLWGLIAIYRSDAAARTNPALQSD